MGCSKSRDYTADIEKLSNCQDLIRQIRDNQKVVLENDPDHDIFDNTNYSMWAAQVQQLVAALRGDKDGGKDPNKVKKSKRQVTLSADELENLILWIDKAKYEMGKTDNKWLEDSDLAFIHTMKNEFITEVNKLKKEARETKKE